MLAAELAAVLPQIERRSQHYDWGRLAVIAVLAHGAVGQTEAAVALLARLLRLAARDKWRLLFLSEGESLAALLTGEREALLGAGAPADYLNDLIAAFPHTTSALPEPLTDREQEVIALIAAGLSNQAIADQLTITYGTAKRHVNNIYAKLGVNSRAQAILKAQELRIVNTPPGT